MDIMMTESMREAAEEASIADGVFVSANDLGAVPAKSNQKKQDLRRGKWTPEEEAFATRLIEDFRAGLLPLAGKINTTLHL